MTPQGLRCTWFFVNFRGVFARMIEMICDSVHLSKRHPAKMKPICSRITGKTRFPFWRLLVRKFALLAACAAVALATQSRADDAAVKELLDKAVKAIGGTEKAAGINQATLKGKAKATENGMTLEFTFDLSMQDFDRIRIDINAMVGGRTEQALMILNGDKMWMKDANRNKVEEAPKEIQQVIQQFFLAIRMSGNLAKLAGQKDVELTHGGEGKVNDTSAAILRISRKERPDINIFFDTKTGLPLKSESQIKDPDGAEEKKYEFHFSDFKEMNGAKLFGKIKVQRDGKDLVEMELNEFKFGEKFEANNFDKPQ
jgi:outer membrane lipoprotein-sorting protein